MGFTIGGIREKRDVRSGVRRRGRTADGPARAAGPVPAAAEYTALWGWDVTPGARALDGACSCGASRCPAPGAHPLGFVPDLPAGSTLDDVAEAWSQTPGAAVLLPVGRAFDVLDVSGQAGRRAVVRLERMGVPVGPVTLTPTGRAHFFVAPGAAAELPALLYRMGWDDAGLDLRCPLPGSHVTAPPSDHAGLGPVTWLRAPTLDTAAAPPPARLLLGTLAYVSQRSTA